VGTSPAASAAEPRAGEANPPPPMVTLTVGIPVRVGMSVETSILVK
jgi:hypothetical protein